MGITKNIQRNGSVLEIYNLLFYNVVSSWCDCVKMVVN